MNYQDKDWDRIYKRVFGHAPRFAEEEEEGYSVAYDRDGNRFFAMPTGDESILDYI
jgi:hypothetical protein